MSDELVRARYAERAEEYTRLLGDLDQMHARDRQRIAGWARQSTGALLDAGCGPGHWTDFLRRVRGGEPSDACGVDVVPQFISSARIRFPDTAFQVASMRDLGFPDGSLGGVLAWYSLIHLPPSELPAVLSEFARVLAPKGSLLLGFFEGPELEPFPHAVTTAYFWPIGRIVEALAEAGFSVLEVESRRAPDSRPHAAVSAVRGS